MHSAQWSKNPANTTPLDTLRKADNVPVGWREDLEQVQANPKDRTTANIYKTLALTFSCLSNPTVARIIERAHDPAERFDIEKFLSNNGTLYMLGEDRPIGGVGPLFTTLTGVLYDQLTQLASRSPGGRLDPPGTFVLDEAALICSVPLERWTADSRKKNISVHIAMQTPSQLYARWGAYPGQSIWTNCTLCILGGLSVGEHLDEISKRCWDRDEKVEALTESGDSTSISVSSRKVPVLTPQQVSSLKPWRALVIRRQLPVFLVDYKPVWKRRDVKRAKRAGKVPAKAAEAVPSPTPVVPATPRPAVAHRVLTMEATGSSGSLFSEWDD